MTERERASPRRPWDVDHPASYDEDDARSMRILACYAKSAVYPPYEGEDVPVPTPQDVKRVLDWIIVKACRTFRDPFIADDPAGRRTAFLCGRAFVGRQINGLIEMSPADIRKKQP